MSYYTEVDDARDDYEWTEGDYFWDDPASRKYNASTNPSGYKVKGFPKYTGKRKKKLSGYIEDLKNLAANAPVGRECQCPMCNNKFIKKSYQNKFCSDYCRTKYHNKRKIYA